MQRIPSKRAERHLAEIIEKLPPGEEVVLTGEDKPVATIRVTPTPPELAPRKFETLKGTILYIAPDFDALLADFKEYI